MVVPLPWSSNGPESAAMGISLPLFGLYMEVTLSEINPKLMLGVLDEEAHGTQFPGSVENGRSGASSAPRLNPAEMSFR